MSAYQTNAIVLKRENIFEADRVYHLYTEDFGKVRAIAGGVRKINAKLAGHLEPFNLIWAELIAKRNGDLFITTALSYKELTGGGVSPAKTALFAKMADFTSKMLKGPQKDDIMWNFVLNSFLAAGEIEATGSPGIAAAKPLRASDFLSDFKNGFIKIMGFGDDFNEALYYLGDFGVV